VQEGRRGERSGGRSRPRTGRDGSARGTGERGERRPRNAAVSDVPASNAPASVKPESASAASAKRPDQERAPHKRRHRRGGKRVAEKKAANAARAAPFQRPDVTPPSHVPATRQSTTSPPIADRGKSSSLWARIGRGLKSLVTRSPSNQH